MENIILNEAKLTRPIVGHWEPLHVAPEALSTGPEMFWAHSVRVLPQT